MKRRPPTRAAASLLGTLLPPLLLAGPADGQSKPFPPEIRRASSPLAEATAMKRQGMGAGEIARALRGTRGRSDAEIAGVLLALEYPPPEIGTALLEALRLPPEDAAASLARARGGADLALEALSRAGGPLRGGELSRARAAALLWKAGYPVPELAPLLVGPEVPVGEGTGEFAAEVASAMRAAGATAVQAAALLRGAPGGSGPAPPGPPDVARALHRAGFPRPRVEEAIRSAFRMSPSAVAELLSTVLPETPPTRGPPRE